MSLPVIEREEGPEVPTRVPKNLLIIKIKAASMRIHKKANGRNTIEDSSAWPRQDTIIRHSCAVVWKF
jgi:hypothetical protein